MTTREEFEIWFAEDAMPCEADWFKKDDDGDYELHDTSFAWRAWQASRAALCVELPANNYGEVREDEVVEALDQAGVKYK